MIGSLGASTPALVPFLTENSELSAMTTEPLDLDELAEHWTLLDGDLLELAGAQPIQRPLGAERLLQATECLGVGAVAGSRQVGLGQKRVDRISQARGRLARRAQPSTRPLRGRHRRECVGLTGCGSDAIADGC